MTDRKCDIQAMFEFFMYLDLTAFAINKAREKELKQYGISTIQQKILTFLKHLDHEPTIQELAHHLFREQAPVSNITNNMVKQGLLRKYRDPNKLSSTRLAITPKGEKIYYQAVKRDSLINILSTLSLEECKQFKPCLNKLFNKATEEAELKGYIDLPELWASIKHAFKDEYLV